ncbi:unnamed protein product [Ectocarpus sp. CCAP 1310/34]|nr:unnamed protein product [Ectocarpus sp. CCAP 1310/34]
MVRHSHVIIGAAVKRALKEQAAKRPNQKM